MTGKLTAGEIARLSEEMEQKTPEEILRWAIGKFAPSIAMSSSFQTQSLPLLHMTTRIMPDIPVFFLDTGYHFWDSLMFREQLTREWHLNVVNLYRDSKWDLFRRHFGRDLPHVDPNLCCFIHKVQPMQKALQGLQAWITGIRRDQTSTRARAHILELQADGLIKVNPLLNWNRTHIAAYAMLYDLPDHPLLEKGYPSIGCALCMRPIQEGESERAGRWAGKGKTECGLHTEMFQNKDVDTHEAQREFLFKMVP